MQTIINDSTPTEPRNIPKYFPFVYLDDIFIKLEDVDKNVTMRLFIRRNLVMAFSSNEKVIPCEIQKIIAKSVDKFNDI